ncbi:MAG: hypothetical protein EOO77_13030 [Oxalobacteraceae bacterium]|nr:MAG: hypothetical protein EOO77_13030 [Oxalobacteraceae bacterium]
MAQPLLQARLAASKLDTSPATRSNTMTAQALLLLPMVQTLFPVKVVSPPKRAAAAEQLKQRVTNRTGPLMLGCFADLAEFDAQLGAVAGPQAD